MAKFTQITINYRSSCQIEITMYINWIYTSDHWGRKRWQFKTKFVEWMGKNPRTHNHKTAVHRNSFGDMNSAVKKLFRLFCYFSAGSKSKWMKIDRNITIKIRREALVSAHKLGFTVLTFGDCSIHSNCLTISKRNLTVNRTRKLGMQMKYLQQIKKNKINFHILKVVDAVKWNEIVVHGNKK